MATMLDRLKQEADLYESATAAVKAHGDTVDAHRLVRLRGFLNTEIYNMVRRCEDSDPTITIINRSKRAAPWLHGKKIEKTYRDWAENSKRKRTDAVIKELLRLCGYDQKLLLAEYARTLNWYFPISSEFFKWSPQLIESEPGLLTIHHKWARVKKEVLEEEV